MEKKKISVVIPYFRREDIFDETIQSVLKQTLKPDEIIVVDDASGGNTTEFLSSYLPQIKLITLEENGGVSNARNVGVGASSGDLIAFIDSDDLWEPTKLEKQYRYLAEKPECSVVHTACVNFFPDGEKKVYDKKPLRLTVKDLIAAGHVMYQSVMMYRDVYQKFQGFDVKFRQTEDYEFTMRLVTGGVIVDFVPEPLTLIRHGREDKLSLNWKGFIKGHVGVVWKYHKFYASEEGRMSPWKHTAKYLMKGGYKQGGLLGRFIYLLGRLMWFPKIL